MGQFRGKQYCAMCNCLFIHILRQRKTPDMNYHLSDFFFRLCTIIQMVLVPFKESLLDKEVIHKIPLEITATNIL